MIVYHSCAQVILTVCEFGRKRLRRHFKIKLRIYRRGWQKNKMSLQIGKTEPVHVLSCRDQNVKMANTTMSPTKSVDYLGVYLDKNLTFEAHVQSVLAERAKNVTVEMRLRHILINVQLWSNIITFT